MADTDISVACIGLGRMGAGIAHNIQRAGFRLIVYNRTHQKTEPFIASGAALARTPREAAQEADVVVTSLMDDASVLEVVDGADGVLAGMRPGAVHAGTTTTSPNLSTRLTELHASQGSHYVAAHVLGRPDAAATGKLITLLAGTAEAIERARQVIDTYSVGFTLDAGLKDIHLILDAAAEVRVPLPCGSLIKDKCIVARERGLNQCDWSVFTAISPPDAS